MGGTHQSKTNGAKLVVVDPMKNDEADIADIWLPIKPGADVYLFLSWIKFIIENKLYDKEFVENIATALKSLKII